MASFADLITFTRASIGWYFNSSGNLVQAAIDEPRFNYTAIAGRQPGLLIEPAATEDNPQTTVTTSTVSPTGTLTVANQTLNVFGVFPGVLCTSGGTASNVARTTIGNAFAVTSGVTRTIEVYYRVGTSGRFRLNIYNSVGANAVVVNGVAGTPAVIDSSAGTTVIDSDVLCSDGLTRRLRLLFTPNTTGNIQIGFGPDSATSGQTVTFVTFFTRVGSVFTTPILTSGSAVTRSADVALVNQTSTWFDSNNGTFFGEFRFSYTDNNLIPEVTLFRINSGNYNTLGHAVYIGTSGPNTGRPNYRLETATGTVTVEGLPTDYNPGSDIGIKLGVTYSNSTAKFCFNGGTVYSDVPLGTLPDMTTYSLRLGGTSPVTVINLTYKPSTTSSTDLQSLTT